MDAERLLSLTPGNTFRGLTIHSALGNGSMGVAYLASHPVLQMPLVIKAFRGLPDEDLFQEAYLAARVSSPHTVSVLDAGFDDGCPFVVLSYVDGIDLQELLGWMAQTNWTMPVEVVVRILLDACQGLHAIHQAGVVHRDVKPANLFLRGNGTATIGDFGIALPTNPRSAQVVAGSPPFMPPEQWLSGPCDRRTDVYALGATAHMLATGRYPFPGQTVAEMKEAHLELAYVAPSRSDPREAFLFSVVARMMTKEPQSRYRTAAAVADALSIIAEPGVTFVRQKQTAFRVGGITLQVVVGDMTAIEADAIVNAANTGLTMDLGLAAFLRQAGGSSIETEALTHAPVRMGDVIWTGAGKLRASWVAHAVSAVGGAICLQRCSLRVLLEAEARRLTSVAFPALGTGIGRVPMELAAQLMLEAVRTFAQLKPTSVRDVIVVLRDPPAFGCWIDILSAM